MGICDELHKIVGGTGGVFNRIRWPGVGIVEDDVPFASVVVSGGDNCVVPISGPARHPERPFLQLGEKRFCSVCQTHVKKSGGLLEQSTRP